MADTTTNTLPVLDFSEISRSEVNKTLVVAPTEKGEVVQAVVDKVTVAEVKNGDGTLQFMFDLKPLDVQGKPVFQSVRHFVQIPKVNPNRPGHMITKEQAENYYKTWRDTIRALEGPEALMAGPRKVEEVWVDAEGEPMTSEKFDTWRAESRAQIDTYIAKYYKLDTATGKRGYEDLKGAVVYCSLYRNKKGYTNINFLRHDAGDMTVVPAQLVALA